jgi:hypothetical protein
MLGLERDRFIVERPIADIFDAGFGKIIDSIIGLRKSEDKQHERPPEAVAPSFAAVTFEFRRIVTRTLPVKSPFGNLPSTVCVRAIVPPMAR